MQLDHILQREMFCLAMQMHLKQSLFHFSILILLFWIQRCSIDVPFNPTTVLPQLYFPVFFSCTRALVKNPVRNSLVTLKHRWEISPLRQKPCCANQVSLMPSSVFKKSIFSFTWSKEIRSWHQADSNPVTSVHADALTDAWWQARSFPP